MTTPHQGPPDGAVIIGGGEFRFGQHVDENAARELFDLEPPSGLADALELLPAVLSTLPNDSMKPWQRWLGLADEDRANGTVKERIVQALTKNRLTKLEEENQGVTELVGDIVSSGTNFIVNPGFENGLFAQGAGTYSTEQAMPGGTRSLKILSTGLEKYFTFLSDDSVFKFIPVMGNDVFYCEVWVYGKTTNTQTSGGTGGIKLIMEPYYGLSALTPISLTLTASTALNGTWTKLSGYITMPPTASRVKIKLGFTNAVNSNETYYFDDVVVREVTLAKSASDAATSAQATANTGVTNADAANTNANQAHTRVDVYASGGGGNLCTNPGFEDTTLNLVNGSYVTTPVRSGSRAAKLTGLGALQFLALTSTKTQQSFITGGPSRSYYVECWARGDTANTQTGTTVVGAIGVWGYDTTGNYVSASASTVGFSPDSVGKGAWVKLSGTVTLPSTTTIAKVAPMIYLSTPALSGNSWYFDDVIVRDVTEANSAQTTANTAVTNAGAAQTTANTAQTTAQDANELAVQVVESGSNLIANCDFERGLTSTQPLIGVYTVDQKYSGTRSLRIQGTGGTKTYYLLSEGLTPRTIPAAEGDVFYCEMYVYGDTITGTATDGIRLVFEPMTRLGGNLADSYVAIAASTALNNVWTKVSGYVTMPAGTVKFKVAIELTNGATGFFYFDQIIVREVTLANTAATNVQTVVDGAVQSIDGSAATGAAPTTFKTKLQQAWANIWDGHNGTTTSTVKTPLDIRTTAALVKSKSDSAFTNAGLADNKAVAAQNDLTLRARDFTNMVAGLDFESTNPLDTASGFVVDTAQFRSGTKSLRIDLLAAGGTQQHPTYKASQMFECKAGEQFYVELWVKKSADYANTHTNDPRFRLVRGNGANAGQTIGNLQLVPANIPTTNWTRLSATYTIPSDATTCSQIFFTLTGPQPGTMTGSLWIDEVVVRRVVVPDSLSALPQSKITNLPTDMSNIIDGVVQAVDGGSATGASSSVTKTKLQLAWANLWDGLRGTSGATVKLPSDVRIEAAALKSKADTTDTALGATNTNQGTLVDNVTKSFTGDDTVTGTSLAQALAAMKQARSEIEENTKSIQGLLAKKDAVSSGGATYAVDFSDFSTMAAAGFSVSYTGAGTSTIGISGGVAQWTVNDSSSRDAKIIYSQSTATDFQSVRGTMASPPQPPSGTTPYFYAIARVSPDGLNYVWARAYAQSLGVYKADIGYCVAGVETTWASNVALTWSLDMKFVAGVGTNARQYQIWSGNKVVYSYTESGTSSRLCSNAAHTAPSMHDTSCTKYRQWGAIAQVRNGKVAGKVSATTATDNGTPSVNGSTARMIRSSTGTASYAAGSNNLPTSFFDAVSFESLDVDADTATGTFTVTQAKPYCITGRIKLSTGTTAWGALLLEVYDSSAGTWSATQWGDTCSQNTAGMSLHAQWIQYLDVNDKVRLLTYRSVGTSNELTGGTNGSETYFSIAAMG